MAFIDWVTNRDKEKQEEAQQREQTSADKAKDKETALARAQADAGREAEKQREAEERGDNAAAGRAKERVDELNQQSGTLKGERDALEAVEKAAHEMVSVYQSRAQTSQILDLATAYVAAEVAEKTPLPGSVAERKQEAARNAEQEAALQPKVGEIPDGQKAEMRKAAGLIEQATKHLQPGPELNPESQTDDSGGGNAALLQKQANQERTQAAMSPTDKMKGKTALGEASHGENATKSNDHEPAVKDAAPVARRSPTWER